MFEDTLKDVQTKNEAAIGLVRSKSSATMVSLCLGHSQE